jgi:fatty acid synthase subunit alpha
VLEPRIAQDAIEGGEGHPTPMLAVSGLTRSTLNSHITKTNIHLPENAKLSIGLHNGAKNAIIVGPAHSLYGLVMALRKIRAPTGADQSKIPYSQRKIVFSMRFLVVNVPYHSDYLQGATEKVFEIDLEGKELWTPEQLAIPVFHTGDGAFCLFVCFGDPTPLLTHSVD